MSVGERDAALSLVTPEQVAIHFRPGAVGGRVGAVFLDLVILEVVSVGLVLAFALGGAGWNRDVAVASMLLLGFVLRTFYFPFFELAWRGQTPGKRWRKLRVVARDGGPLTAEMVFVRSLTRELEVFLPLSILLGGGAVFPEAPVWVPLATLAWAGALLAVPLVNRQSLRVGDLLAGTVVVEDPRPQLLDDLVVVTRESRADREYAFRRDQLAIYGVLELEVLEELLRRPPTPHLEETMERVAATIRKKVGWEPAPGQVVQPERFLRAFYAAQRERLEQGLLVGQRRESKEG